MCAEPFAGAGSQPDRCRSGKVDGGGPRGGKAEDLGWRGSGWGADGGYYVQGRLLVNA